METSAFRDLYPFAPHYHSIGANRLHFVDEGEGDPVLMVHGNPTWSFYYRNVVLGLRDRWRTVVPDHIGCGRSDKPQDYPYTLRTHIDNLESLVESLGLDRITLMVHDWGGPIGWGYAKRHPDKVRRFVVLNTGAFAKPQDAPFPATIRFARLPLIGDFAVRSLNGFVLGALQTCTMHRDRLTDQVRAGFKAPYDSYENRVAVLRFVQDIPTGPDDPAWQPLVEIEQALPGFAGRPMLFAWGLKDFVFTEAYLNQWLKHFPAASVERYPDAGHYVLEDAHERIVPRVRKFLEANPIA